MYIQLVGCQRYKGELYHTCTYVYVCDAPATVAPVFMVRRDKGGT